VTKTWTATNLAVARMYLAAASLPKHNMVIFAGGCSTFPLNLSIFT
jgi:hypothetical protein